MVIVVVAAGGGHDGDVVNDTMTRVIERWVSVEFPKTQAVHRLALLIISKARGCCEDVGIQTLINIALVGVRLRVEIDVLRPLACDIAQELMGRAAELNAIDVKQWDEVHRYCGIPPNLRTGS